MVADLAKIHLLLTYQIHKMKPLLKKSLVISMLLGIAIFTFADRGVGKKAKVKTLLNITTTSTLRSSISLNIKSGLLYKGSLSTSGQTFSGNSMLVSNILTYQKGNTTYIIPYKNKIVIPDIKAGYTGVKMIIRSRN